MPTTDPKKPATKSLPRITAAATPAAIAKPAAESAPAAKRAKASTDTTPTAKRAKAPSAPDTPAPPRRRATRKSAVKASISEQERRHLIAVAAYYIAERGSFASGSPSDHWLEAERQIDAMIAAGLPD